MAIERILEQVTQRTVPRNLSSPLLYQGKLSAYNDSADIVGNTENTLACTEYNLLEDVSII